jgi:hypothetical protein
VRHLKQEPILPWSGKKKTEQKNQQKPTDRTVTSGAEPKKHLQVTFNQI